MKLKHLLFAAALALPLNAWGLSVDFDLTDPDSADNLHQNGIYADAFNYEVDGIGLSVSGWSNGGDRYAPWRHMRQAHVGLWNGGLGVERGHRHTVDNIGYDYDFLVLEFDQEVVLDSFSLGYISHGLDSDVSTGAEVDNFWVSSGNVLDATLGDNLVNPTGIASTLWLIGAYHPYFGDFHDCWPDSFKLDGVSVSAVPLPAGVWLMLSALAGLGVFKRRRQAKIALS